MKKISAYMHGDDQRRGRRSSAGRGAGGRPRGVLLLSGCRRGVAVAVDGAVVARGSGAPPGRAASAAGLRISRIAWRANGDHDAGGDLEVDGALAEAGDGAVHARWWSSPACPTVSESCIAWAWACDPLALPGGQHEEQHDRQATRMSNGKYCSTTGDASLPRRATRGGCGPVTGRSGTSALARSLRTRATGRDAHGRGRTSCAPARGV